MSDPESTPALLQTLTSEEENFALGVIEYGGNIGAAYRAAFGKKVSNPAARGRELINRPEIALRIKKLADACEEHAFISLGNHFMQLARLRDLGVKTGDIRTALAAEVKRGELAGYYAPKGEKEPTDGVKFVQINMLSAPANKAMDMQEWSKRFGNAPTVIENGNDS